MSHPRLTLAASMLVTFVLGSVHAFSVLIAPFESLLSLPRADVSLIYAFALVAITGAVLTGYRFYGRLAAWALVALTCIAAAGGLALAALSTDWWSVFVGYSLVFGFSNGIGYGYTLQLAGRVMPASRGIAMAAVTAAYAAGSVIFAELIGWRLSVSSLASALLAVAAAILGLGLLAAAMLRAAGAEYGSDDAVRTGPAPSESRTGIARFWIAYLCSVFAGLMAIGHAAGIALSRGAMPELAARAAVSIGIGSALGGFAAGWLVARLPVRALLTGLPAIAALALVSIVVARLPGGVIALLSLVGFSYGAVIAVYPVAIAVRFAEQGPRAYGRVFTAWGLAGLLAPWTAGRIFDVSGGYDAAMLVAAAVALISVACAATLDLGKP